jgi:hypothetical protein
MVYLRGKGYCWMDAANSGTLEKRKQQDAAGLRRKVCFTV